MSKTINLTQINILNDDHDYKTRYERFVKLLDNHNPVIDIVTIQEVSYPDYLISLMFEIGFSSYTKTKMFRNKHGIYDCGMIFSRGTVEKLDFNNPHERSVLGAQVTVDDRLYNVFGVHLSWGPARGFERLNQLTIVDRIAEKYEVLFPGSVSVLAGDFNTDSESRAIRFLKGWDLGSDNLRSTLWMDAFSEAGDEDSWTTADHSTNKYGQHSAIKNGVIDVSLLPKRRIDYIFSRGWLYGKNGYPVDFGIFEGSEEFSDHNGIFASLLVL